VVLTTLLAELGRLTQLCVDPAVRDTAAAGAAGWSEQQVRDRLEVWPSLLHLITRSVLDAPFPAPAAVVPATGSQGGGKA
jgi:hypothetical protein